MENAQQVTDLAQLFSAYGPYGFLAILFFCVSHLYRAQTQLSREFRETIQKNATDLAALQQETLTAIRANTEAVERVQDTLNRSQS